MLQNADVQRRLNERSNTTSSTTNSGTSGTSTATATSDTAAVSDSDTTQLSHQVSTYHVSHSFFILYILSTVLSTVFTHLQFSFYLFPLYFGYWHQRADERHGNPPPKVTRSY